MADKTTYLLPIWIDLTHENHKEIMSAFNDALTEFIEEQCNMIAAICAVNVQWSINKHVNLEGD